MITSLTCALVTASVLSMMFRSTRAIGIICVTVLTFLYPIPTMTLAALGLGIYIYWRFYL